MFMNCLVVRKQARILKRSILNHWSSQITVFLYFFNVPAIVTLLLYRSEFKSRMQEEGGRHTHCKCRQFMVTQTMAAILPRYYPQYIDSRIALSSCRGSRSPRSPICVLIKCSYNSYVFVTNCFLGRIFGPLSCSVL